MLWEIERQWYIERCDLPSEVAHWLTIVRWMVNGDLRPLSAAMREGELPSSVWGVLAEMIDHGRLKVVPPKRGSPRKPERFARDLVAAAHYEDHPSNSNAAFQEIAEAIGMSEQTVRAAVTSWRKSPHAARKNK